MLWAWQGACGSLHLTVYSIMPATATDLCTQWTQLEDHEITPDAIQRILLPVSDDLWVAAACLDRLTENHETQRSLLDLGIKRTEVAVKRAQSFLEHSALAEEDDGVEENTVTEEHRKAAILESYFREESLDRQLCHLRCVLLDRLDRLNTFVEISKQPPGDSRENDESDDGWTDDPWDVSMEGTPSVSSLELLPHLPPFLSHR